MTLVAVSGPTRISPQQGRGIEEILTSWLDDGDTLVTGGAYGVDTRAALWALGAGFPVILVVPRTLMWHRELRTCSGVGLVEVDGSYMDRNEEIAELSYELVAFPHTKRERLRSGTWATIRRFEARMKPVTVRPLSLWQ